MSELLNTQRLRKLFFFFIISCCFSSAGFSNTHSAMKSSLENANNQFFSKVSKLDLDAETVLNAAQYAELSNSLRDAIIAYRPFSEGIPKYKFVSRPVNQSQLNKTLNALIYYTNAARLLMVTLSHQSLAAILSELPDEHSQVQRTFVRNLVSATQRQFRSGHTNNPNDYSTSNLNGHLYDVPAVFDNWRVTHRPQWLIDYIELTEHIIENRRFLSTRNYSDQAAKKAFYDIKAGFLYLTGKVALPKEYFISIPQINSIQPNLQPGDIAVIKHYYKLTNLAFNGDWSHGLIYLGSWNRMKNYFDNNRETSRYFAQLCRNERLRCSNFSTYLNASMPKVVQYYKTPSEYKGHSLPRVFLESLGEGVILSNIYDAILKDQLAIFRPKMSKLGKAQAILRSLRYVSREYDYSFTLHSRQQLVCTEIIFNAYSPGPGLSIPEFNWKTSIALGKPVVYATDIAETYIDQRNHRNPLLELIYYLKADERNSRAIQTNILQ